MNSKKEKACHRNDRPKEGDMLLDTAKKISESSDPVNIIASLIEYHRKNLRVK